MPTLSCCLQTGLLLGDSIDLQPRVPDKRLDQVASACSARGHAVGAQGTSERGGMTFSLVSGAVVAAATLRYGSRTPDGWYPWALFDVSIGTMLTRAGTAWIEFVLQEGDGMVFLLAAPETLNISAGMGSADMQGIACNLWHGVVYVDGARARECSGGWCVRMTAGERVRLEYTAATRMISVMWRIARTGGTA